jgi:hypothetical protein
MQIQLQAQLPAQASAGRRGEGADDTIEREKIGVQRIRIRHTKLEWSAVAGNFIAADKILLNWLQCSTAELACDFDIVYQDGRVLSGYFEFLRRGAARPALMQFVRRAAMAMCRRSGDSEDDGEDAPPGVLRGLANRPLAFLERYETEDYTCTRRH